MPGIHRILTAVDQVDIRHPQLLQLPQQHCTVQSVILGDQHRQHAESVHRQVCPVSRSRLRKDGRLIQRKLKPENRAGSGHTLRHNGSVHQLYHGLADGQPESRSLGRQLRVIAYL
ncbi:hypothetical protein D3C80_1820380 [compost metagenome]